MDAIYEIISALCKLSDMQLDKKIKDRLNRLIGEQKEFVKKEILKCIDECQSYSLSSAFEIVTMKTVYEYMLDGSNNDYSCKIQNHEIKFRGKTN